MKKALASVSNLPARFGRWAVWKEESPPSRPVPFACTLAIGMSNSSIDVLDGVRRLL